MGRAREGAADGIIFATLSLIQCIIFSFDNRKCGHQGEFRDHSATKLALILILFSPDISSGFMKYPPFPSTSLRAGGLRRAPQNGACSGLPFRRVEGFPPDADPLKAEILSKAYYIYAAPKLGPQRIVTQACISRAVFRS